MPTIQCQLCNANYPMPTIQCQVSNANYPMPNIQCRLFNANYSMPTIQCQVSNANYPMLYTMPTMQCQLIQCQLFQCQPLQCQLFLCQLSNANYECQLSRSRRWLVPRVSAVWSLSGYYWSVYLCTSIYLINIDRHIIIGMNIVIDGDRNVDHTQW